MRAIMREKEKRPNVSPNHLILNSYCVNLPKFVGYSIDFP